VFDGNNPKLWQRRCQEYFQHWATPLEHWVSYGSSQFIGAVATWLESYLTKFPQAGWGDFVQSVQHRFMRNQHQVLLRRMLHISQTGTVADYVQRFSDLVDQISAYSSQSDPLQHLTKFLDGLSPAVHVLVAIHQPADLDAAYTMAFLYEELGDGGNPFGTGSSPTVHHQHFQPLPTVPPPPPARWVSKLVEEKRLSEAHRTGSEGRWSSLKAYRRARGLCFTCGER
jgi:hypothetical protein